MPNEDSVCGGNGDHDGQDIAYCDECMPEDQALYQSMLTDMESEDCAVISTPAQGESAFMFCGKLIATGDEPALRLMIEPTMIEKNYWPSVYFVNERGNTTLVSLKRGGADKPDEWVEVHAWV